MIEPTEEMNQAFWGALLGLTPEDCGAMSGSSRAALAAVLAIVERDYAVGPQGCVEPAPGEPFAYCQLARGHQGKHTATVERAVDW